MQDRHSKPGAHLSPTLLCGHRGGKERHLCHSTSLLKGMLGSIVILFSGIDFFSQIYLGSYTDGYIPLMSEMKR